MFDLHVHSVFSGDGHAYIEDMCAEAVKQGLSEIAFTEHVDHNPADVSYGKFELDEFCAQVDAANRKFAGKLNVLKGIEFAEPQLYPAELRAFGSDGRLDVIIGSVHWVGDVLISSDSFEGRDVEEMYLGYFNSLLQAVEMGGFDVLAHLDIVKRFGVQYVGPFQIELFRKQITAILAAAVERKIALEVNTSGLRQPCVEAFPSIDILKLFRELGGELVTIGSDAHRIRHLGFGLADGLELIREAGFDAVTVYRHRQPELVSIADELS